MTDNIEAAIILGSPVVAFLLGMFLAKQLKMQNLGWKLGLILGSLALGISLCSLREAKRGIDLRGGTILIYEVDEEKTAQAVLAQTSDAEMEATDGDVQTSVDMGALIEQLTRRINPSGVRETVIRPYGRRQVEIIIPDVSPTETDLIKAAIRNTGFLKFRIVADRTRNQLVWDAGEAALASDDEAVRNSKFVLDGDGNRIGEWILLERVDRTNEADDELPPFRVDPTGLLTRELVDGEVEVLAVIDPVFNVEGRHLRSVSADFDDNAQPCVTFQMNAEGSGLFGGLTGSNLPDQQAGSYAKLGIVMDDKLLSAPRIISTITTHGEISGRFTQPEVDFLVRVLRAGHLPAVLRPEPISESQISPLLGKDTIRKGTIAIGISLVAVLGFMLIYYRFAGVVACLALAMNLVLIVGLMILIQGAFTLPGLAGLVLTVGMSVDANVLIFERIREEMRRGATLRMSIRNGFGRATTTIVDANVTTFITAVILYAIGTDNLKGFAVTLMLGILMSMYTAIFCSRVVFDIAERKRWIKTLNMAQILGETHIGFIGKRGYAMVASALCIVVGVGAVVSRGSKLLDIDFTGGSSVQCLLVEPMEIEQVRERLAGIADDVWVTEVNPQGRERNTVYKIDTSIDDEKELQQKVQTAFTNPDNGESLLKVHAMRIVSPPAPLDDGPAENAQSATLADAEGLLAWAGPQEPTDEPATESSTTAPPQDADTDSAPTPGSDAATSDPAPADGATESDAADNSNRLTFRTQATLSFDEEEINSATLSELLELAAESIEMTPPRLEMSYPGWDGKSNHGSQEWTVKFTTTPEQTQTILDQVEDTMDDTPVWLSSSKIGGKVAGDMRNKAIVAIGLSLIGIVGYIWVRFQRVTYGLAAVLALVHDVTITLGAVALSYYLASVGQFLLIDEFKISLPIVAAFLTIIGYSLNDTIVVFDRIREVKGKSPRLTSEIIDTSINQTLSRTLLTSLTTLLVVVILYTVGGQGIHGFAFALLVGVLVGTYSSIFVASPALLWMSNWFDDRAASTKPVATTVRQ